MRLSLHVTGIVQGVGFRPFLYQQAQTLGLTGFVQNGRSGVVVEVQGANEAVFTFVRQLSEELPPPGRVSHVSSREIAEREGDAAFLILPSEEGEAPRPLLPPDLAMCEACKAETLAPSGRRSGYSFTCCARCGPRHSIIRSLPYDRARTSMSTFLPCADCRREYEDPNDRRFHAEPISCPACGPILSLLDSSGFVIADGDEALSLAVNHLRTGKIVALRGLGGFQLLADATNSVVVQELRRRKERDAQPFAVLYADIDEAERDVSLSQAERACLLGPEAPILLARRRTRTRLCAEVAPDNPLVGVLLPATPLHQLLAMHVKNPLVCTSGNISGEPLCTDTEEALKRLSGIADMFLTHNRPIVRPIDDSVVREGPGNLIHVMRRARGFAPLPVVSIDDPRSILAFGAFLKSTLSLTSGGALITSQHLGDMDDVRSIDLLERTAREMCQFYDTRPALLACDMHPDFPSTRLAERLASEWRVPLVRVQHHHAHIAAVMAEHGLSGEVLGLAWDGYGFGSDTRAWGGEALVVNDKGFRRVASFSPFPLPGGDRATREPRRCGLGLLSATLGRDETLVSATGLFDETKTKALLAFINNKNSSPETSSVGRLFDAVASLIGLQQQTSFEGQAAMALEFCAETFLSGDVQPYPIPLSKDTLAIAHLEPLVRALLADRAAGASLAFMAARFQESLVDLALRIALRVGLPSVALSGGCFQNAFLARATAERLRKAGFSCFMPRAVPSNDGGISVGQILVASAASIGQGVN